MEELSAGTPPRQVVVAISGASGAVYGLRLLQVLQELPQVRTHLVVSPTGWRTVAHELAMERQELCDLADAVHDVGNLGAPIASGSFACDAMVVAPCSMRTLAAITHGLTDNLITRAADVMLKERRRLVLLARETPLHLGHLRNMVAVTEMGAIVCPPVPAFYMRPKSLDDVIGHTVGRVLDLLDIPHAVAPRWSGDMAEV